MSEILEQGAQGGDEFIIFEGAQDRVRCCSK